MSERCYYCKARADDGIYARRVVTPVTLCEVCALKPDEGDALRTQVGELQAALKEAEVERDELSDRNDTLRLRHEADEAYRQRLDESRALCIQALAGVQATGDMDEQTWDVVADGISALKRERDEARAALAAELPAMWREDLDSLNGCVERLSLERDEAVRLRVADRRALEWGLNEMKRVAEALGMRVEETKVTTLVKRSRRIAAVADAAKRLCESGYDGPFMGESARELFCAVNELSDDT